jgi:predicted ATPase/Tfp pilus assembly protein PilF
VEWLDSPKARIEGTGVSRSELRVLAASNGVYPAGVQLTANRQAPLPAPLTPLVGRQPELAEMALLLQNAQCRLLTLTGPGGIGKTRLALQLAHEQAEAAVQPFPDGVIFVQLAPIRSPEHLFPAIADAIGFVFYGPGEPAEQLFNALRGRTLLLVLDNAEHLLGPLSMESEEHLASLLSALLRRAPGVKVLATSRERLNLQGEWVFEIHGLPIPPPDQTEGLEEYSAVTLFLQSARRVRPGFELTGRDRTAVVRICQLTDGMPLAIELAAAWTRVLSCAEIAQEIERSLDFLSATARDLPERHRSLRTVFDHSWNLLSQPEQRALRIMSVFRGSFQRKAVVRIAGASLPLLSALVDKSLLRRTGQDRYDLHELVRQFAAEKLAGQPEEHGLALESHCEYFMQFMQERETRLTRDREAAAEIRSELEDVRAAWLWALSEGRLDLLGVGASCLARFYRLTGLLREGEMAFDLAVERVKENIRSSGDLEPAYRRLLIQLLVRLAGLFNDRARHDQAVAAAQQAISLSEIDSDVRSEAAARLEWSLSLWRQANSSGARAQVETALTLARPAGVPHLEAAILALLGEIDLSQGRISESLRCYEEALGLFRRIGDRHGESGVLNRLGTAYFTQGNLRSAGDYYGKALQITLEFGDRRGEGVGLNNLGVIHQGLGANFQARQYFDQTLAISRETGDRSAEAAALANLGVSAQRLGDFGLAYSAHAQSLQISREIGDWLGEVNSLSNLGLLAYYRNDLPEAEENQQLVLQMAQERSSPEVESLAWLRLGRVWCDREKLAEALDAYRKSLVLRRDLGRVNLTLEPLAGLARASLALGELAQAGDYAEDILATLDLPFSNLLDSADDPAWVYLCCVRVFQASGDPRAPAVLEQAYDSLQSQAAQIPGEELRKLFLENIPGNRKLLKEISRK